MEDVEAPELGPDGLGSVEIRLRIWLSAWVLLCGPRPGDPQYPHGLDVPSLVLASPVASPERAARAAEMAS